MKVLVLGGAGRIGAAAARRLAANARVTRIAIAGRDLDVAQRVAAELGPIAEAVRLDARDEASVATTGRTFDLIVNTAGPDFVTALPAARGAVAAKAHYCDLDAHGPTAEAMFELDAAARANDRIVLAGIGHVPGISNLLMLHAAQQLDTVDELESGSVWAITPELLAAIGDAAKMRASKRVNASWQQIVSWATRPRVVREGRVVELDAARSATTIALPDGNATVFPISCTEPLTVPRRVPGVRTVTTWFGLLPPELHVLLHRATERFADDPEEATLAFLEAVASELPRWASSGHHRQWARACGTRGGKRARYTCSPTGTWSTTVGPLVTACLHVLDGRIAQRGVLAPEDCFDPLPFLREASQLPEHEPLLVETWD